MLRAIVPLAALVTLSHVAMAIVLLLAFAVDQSLQPTVGSAGAAALTALALLAIVAVGGAAAVHLRGRQARRMQASPPTRVAFEVGCALAGELRHHPYLGNACALAAGFAVGASPRLRRALAEVLRAR